MLALGGVRPGEQRGHLRPPSQAGTGPGHGQAEYRGAGRAGLMWGSEPRGLTPLGTAEPGGGIVCRQEQGKLALPLCGHGTTFKIHC